MSQAAWPTVPALSPRAFHHPPLEPLRRLLARLESAGLRYALGGSGLLAALGLVERVNDWDVNVDAGIDSVVAACGGLEFERFDHGGCHADHKLSFERERAELIAEFAFFVPGGIVMIPTRVTATWNGIPIGSPTAWAAAYALMGEAENDERRRNRAARLFEWLPSRPPEAEVIATLVAQPLPATLAERLAALTRR